MSQIISTVMQQAQEAFEHYRQVSGKNRAIFLETIAEEIEGLKDSLVAIAHQETNLPLPRLQGEIGRTTGQLRMFARLIAEGSWVEASIDTANPDRVPPKPDTRKMLVPIGPVAIFGASNFPFAFSTAGGDTASALAAGVSVVIKAHPAHPETSALMFSAMEKAIARCQMHPFTIQHLNDASNETGKALVMHPLTTAVGFTGSQAGGKALKAYADQREVPIPVFAEMSSINPVVLFPESLNQTNTTLAKTLAGSISLGMGQFCTKPGLLLAIDSPALSTFSETLEHELTQVALHPMLHTGIAKAFDKARYTITSQAGVASEASLAVVEDLEKPTPSLAKVSAKDFIENPLLHEEAFGPFALLVICQDVQELSQALKALGGQLTTTLMATEQDVENYPEILSLQCSLAGRVILNAAPTGVEVAASMVHGGAYPSTFDARYTSVGTSAIKRWVRPICLQGFKDWMLPEELKDGNPLKIWRLVNDTFTNETI
ncbi:aldehyde dehydrogenase (NADP(+)) [Flectobacillus roseus]|uniref:aldehyde dehydrogenase (NADP(+)) n=1 Tax=Flectobacillus roseus TaxID=502259 RepID=UPI0024B7A6E3|nr:aldehyde dehydrogenase (NADP(+)) [Flectobacillus roseus]MDI9868402.1 aldehyde dehydrogenase (NADP(+)) [Flectobacillus roseus]